MSETINVGYIGLGNIGKPCAQHLLTGTLRLYVYDLVPAAMAELVQQGARGCDSVAQLAASCSHVAVCVRDEAQVEALLYGEGGIFSNAVGNTVIAIHSTVTQSAILKWADEAQALGLHLVDAPMTGGAHRAVEGTLCYMVGADANLFKRTQAIFETSAEKVIHAGDVGSGIALKLCNNFIQYTEFVAMAEATRLAESCGLSVDVLREVGLANGVVNDQMHRFVSGRNQLARSCSADEMDAFFGAMAALGRKDLQCALDTANDHRVTLPTAEYVRDCIEAVFLAKDASRPIDQ